MQHIWKPSLPAPLFLGFASLVLACSACKPVPPVPGPIGPDGQAIESPPPPNEEEEKAAKVLADEAAALADGGDADGAIKKRDQLVELYPGTEAGAEETFARALAARDAGHQSRALELFKRLLFYRPTFARGNEAREAYADLLLTTGDPSAAAQMFKFLVDTARPGNDRRRLGMSLARAYDRAGQRREALDMYVMVVNVPGLAGDLRREAEERVFEIATGGLSFREAEELWDEVEDDNDWAFIQPALAFKLAKIYYHTRDYDRSEAMLRLVSGRFASSSYGPQARDFLSRLRARFQVDPRTIGVVLPLSGRYQQYGNRALAAIKLAMGDKSSIELIVKDTAGDPTVAAKAIEDLVLDSHAVAIIGPLFSDEALAAALKAEELSVPILVLSHRQGLPEIGPWVFRTPLTVKAQAVGLAQLAFEKLDMTRFALLYPRSSYGTEFINAFWDEVNKRKGEIRAAESYEHNQKTFQEPVRRLVGRYFMQARRDYREFTRQLRAKRLPPHRTRMALEKFEKTLPPIIDFDAIVIPDSGRNVGLIAPAIAVEDIVLTRDARMLERIKKAMGREDIKPTTLLGASTWNSQQTLDHCERYCEHAVFVDAFYPDSPNPKVREFVTTFRDATGAEPYLREAEAFDTAGLVRSVLTASKPNDRKAFRSSLHQLSAYRGVTGHLRFDEVGEVQKELIALTIEGTDEGPVIRLWDETKRPPEG